MAKKYAKGFTPPCPGNPLHYTLVDRRGYYYWRLKRGSVKPATLNPAMQQYSKALKALSPLIKQLELTLFPLMSPIPTGELHNNLFKWLQKTWISQGRVDYADLRARELHSKYTLQKILRAAYSCSCNNEYIQLHLSVCDYAVKPQNRLVTDFVLEAVLVWGDQSGFQTVTQVSSLYHISTGMDSPCVFQWKPPQQPWLVLLKLVCFEGTSNAGHPMHYGIRVIQTG